MDILTILGTILLLCFGAIWWAFQSGAFFRAFEGYILSEKKHLTKKTERCYNNNTVDSVKKA
jgi:hypothetical protein